jgi:hypothetical protein
MDAAVLKALMSSPDLFPIGLDDRGEHIYFVPMSRESYRASTFLDYRVIRKGLDTYPLSLRELLDAQPFGPRPNPTHYILHGAFCCSTLLTRYLDLVPSLFVLREPDLIRQVLLLKQATKLADSSGDSSLPYSWNSLLELAVTLLSRTYEPYEIALIKCSDLCNCMGEILLERDRRSKLVLISTKLRVFLLAVLKSDTRRRWVRRRVNSALRLNPVTACNLSGTEVNALTDAEVAAYLWLLNMYLYQAVLQKRGECICLLDGDDIANRPSETLLSVTEVLGAPVSGDKLKEMVSHWSCSMHSKNLLTSFDAELRNRELATTDARFGAEADEGVRWATKVASEWSYECPFRIA